MAIDSSIYQNLQAPDVAGSIERGLKMRDFIEQRKEKNALRDAYKQGVVTNPDGTKTIDSGKTLSGLLGGGFVNEARQYERETMADQQAKAQAQAANIKNQYEKNKMSFELLSSATPETWPSVKQRAVDMGLVTANQVPDQWDQKFIDFAKGSTLTQMQRFERENSDRDFAFRQNESKRDQANKDRTYGLDTKKTDAIVRKNQDGGQKVTGDQAKAAGFSQRVRSAEATMDQLQRGGFSGSETSSWVQKFLPQEGKSNQLQKLEQAQRNFVNAVLRRESGAAIPESEFQSANKQYFPQRGDTPDVLEQKRQNRLDALASLEAEAGPGIQRVQDARARIARENPTPVMTPGNRSISILPNANAGTSQVFKTQDIDWAD